MTRRRTERKIGTDNTQSTRPTGAPQTVNSRMEATTYVERKSMRRVKQAPSPDAEALARFRTEVMEVYKRFEEDLAVVSKKYGFEINMWYSPSKIPQPNFKAGRLLLDVDQLYHDRDFQELISEHYPVLNGTRSPPMIDRGRENRAPLTRADMAATELLKKNVELRQSKPDLSYRLGVLDFKRSGDLRLTRSRQRRKDSL